MVAAGTGEGAGGPATLKLRVMRERVVLPCSWLAVIRKTLVCSRISPMCAFLDNSGPIADEAEEHLDDLFNNAAAGSIAVDVTCSAAAVGDGLGDYVAVFAAAAAISSLEGREGAAPAPDASQTPASKPVWRTTRSDRYE